MKTARLKLAGLAIQKVRDSWLRISIAIVGVLASAIAFADDPTLGGGDLGQVAQKLQGEAVSWKTLLWTGSQVAGIIITIVGLKLWVKVTKQEDGRHSHGNAFMIIMLGSLMFFLPTLMGVGASSILSN
jgi:hypothetical protein